VGIQNDIDLRALLPLQCEDGGWEIGYIYKYGSSGIRIGNRGLTTALAVKAVEVMAQSTHQFRRSPSPTLVDHLLPPKLKPVMAGRHRRSSSLKNSLQWLWHGSIFRKSVEV